ncbi:MAG: hypothetical protein HYY64_00610 [Candidatus Rokubacteria bacterium]|nr:hypothetical protein [Candidatus Rokubacteria bacterium]
MERDSTRVVRRVDLTGDLDRHAAEVLQLEIRRLAKRYGIEIEELRIEQTGEADLST